MVSAIGEPTDADGDESMPPAGGDAWTPGRVSEARVSAIGEPTDADGDESMPPAGGDAWTPVCVSEQNAVALEHACLGRVCGYGGCQSGAPGVRGECV